MTAPTPTPATGSPVYCSGPMFSAGDLWEQQAEATSHEGAGYTTYLPQRDGIEVGRVMALLNHPLLEGPIADWVMAHVRRFVFALDMYQLLERCQSLVFNLDGRVPDDGSVVETAAAFTAGKPLVIYKTTPITMLAGTDNPMINGLAPGWSYVNDVAKLPAALGAAIATTNGHASAYTAPANVAAQITLGGKVWDVVEDLRGKPTDTDEGLLAWIAAFAKEMEAQPAAVA